MSGRNSTEVKEYGPKELLVKGEPGGRECFENSGISHTHLNSNICHISRGLSFLYKTGIERCTHGLNQPGGR